MMLAISPDLVDREAMTRTPNACFSFSAETGFYRFARFDELSTTGVNGITKNASKEKGEALLAAGAKVVSETILAELGRPQKNEP